MDRDLAWGANVRGSCKPLNPEQLEALTLAVKVVFAGPTGTFNLEDHATLRRGSGLEKYIHECAQAVVVDAVARRGFVAVAPLGRRNAKTFRADK
jgi:alkylhydroperoxidase family enzyme